MTVPLPALHDVEELGPSSCDPRSNRPDRDVTGRGRLFVRKPEHLGQDERLSGGTRASDADRLAQCDAGRVIGHDPRMAGRHGAGKEAPTTLHLVHRVGTGPARDAEQPAASGARATEGRQRTPGPDRERILRDVVGIAARGKERQRVDGTVRLRRAAPPRRRRAESAVHAASSSRCVS